MGSVLLTIQLHVAEADLPSLNGADMMVIPHIAAERERLIRSMAQVERCVEASADEAAVQAFQWMGGFLARAAYTAGMTLRQGNGRRFDA